MPLRDRPDFQDWLERFEARNARLHGDEPVRPGDVCDGCGEQLEAPVSSAGLCLVCLAETYGRERGQRAGRVAGLLEATLSRLDGMPSEDVRDAVEQVLERYERERGETGELGG
jgi:hypothetical protein